jgi:thiol-disulfide isomerase/thioredoxin
MRTFGSFGGKTIVLNFWATYCAPCVAELPTLEALARDLPADRFAVLAVSAENEEPIRRFLETHRYAIPFYLAAEPPAPALSPPVLPTTFILNEEGQILMRYEGAARWNSPNVLRALNALAAKGPYSRSAAGRTPSCPAP